MHRRAAQNEQKQQKEQLQKQQQLLSSKSKLVANLLSNNQHNNPNNMIAQQEKMLLANVGTGGGYETTTTTTTKVVLNSGSSRARSPRMPSLLRDSLGMASSSSTTSSSTIGTSASSAISPIPSLPPLPPPLRPLDPSEPSTSSPIPRIPPSPLPHSPGGTTARPMLFDLPPCSPFLGPSSSPVPSPQWRLPSAGGGGPGGGSAGISGRTMPKSALLLSKCQAFLKSGANLESGAALERSSTTTAETSGRNSREDQQQQQLQQQTKAAVAAKAIQRHHTLDSASGLPPQPPPSSSSASMAPSSALLLTALQREEMAQPPPPETLAFPETLPSAENSAFSENANANESAKEAPTPAECIFNFDDVFFEEQQRKRDESDEGADEYLEDEEEELRWTEVQEHFRMLERRRRRTTETKEDETEDKSRRNNDQDKMERRDTERHTEKERIGRKSKTLDKMDKTDKADKGDKLAITNGKAKMDDAELNGRDEHPEEEEEEEAATPMASSNEAECQNEKPQTSESVKDEAEGNETMNKNDAIDNQIECHFQFDAGQSEEAETHHAIPIQISALCIRTFPFEESKSNSNEERNKEKKEEEKDEPEKHQNENKQIEADGPEGIIEGGEAPKEEEEERRGREKNKRPPTVYQQMEEAATMESANANNNNVMMANNTISINGQGSEKREEKEEERGGGELKKEEKEGRELEQEEEEEGGNLKKEEKEEEGGDLKKKEEEKDGDEGTNIKPPNTKLGKEAMRKSGTPIEMKPQMELSENLKMKNVENEEGREKAEENAVGNADGKKEAALSHSDGRSKGIDEAEKLAPDEADALEMDLKMKSPPADKQQEEQTEKPQQQQQQKARGKRRTRAAPPPPPLSAIGGAVPATATAGGTTIADSPSPTSLTSSCALPSCSSFASTHVPKSSDATRSSPPPPSSSATSRVIESIQIAGMQLRNVHCTQPGAQLAIGIRLDGREVFRTAAVHLNGNSCVIGEEFNTEEVPRNFHTLQLNLFELVDGARQQRLLGRLKLSRKEMLELGKSLQERWLPISRIRSTEFTEFLGSICVDVHWDRQAKMLNVQVLDFTTWTLAGRRENPLERYSREGGRLQLKLCVAFGKSAFTAVQKMRLSERRGLEEANFDCSAFFVPANCTGPFPTVLADKPLPQSPRADFSANEWMSGVSACSSPACSTPAWAPKGHSQRNSRQFHFPPPSPGPVVAKAGRQQMPTTTASTIAGGARNVQQTQGGITPTAVPLDEPRIHIKIYGQPNGSQDSYCGNVRIPLDPERMQPREASCGPNWFNIRSRTTTKTIQQQLITANQQQQNSGKFDHHFPYKHLTTAASFNSSSSPLIHSQQQQQLHQLQPHHQKRFSQPPPSSPSLFRHCSTPSTSSIKTTPTTGGTPRASVATTRSQPLKTPSISSLFSSSGGGAAAGSAAKNGSILQNKKINNNGNSQEEEEDHRQRQQHQLQLIHQRRSLGDSDLLNMNILGGQQQAQPQPLQHQHNAENLGEIRLKFWHNMDEVLPLVHYQPLYMNLTRSLNFTPYSHSLISIVQRLPIDIEKLAKPLMKIFIHSNQIRHFFRLICSEYVSSCSDVNTLFRSQSLASKVMYEMMKFVGHRYLLASLKPLIDLIYAERKSCEIDPSKLKPGESLEHNFRNITVYAELAFSRVVDSFKRCPQALRELFAELRNVVEQYFPGREDVARLALSSFLIMRFFAAAILNPKLFALKLETPDIDVSRTLVLISKVLQRLANCVVSAHPLTTKEQWLAPVLHRFSDDAHKMAMINFLDQISAPGIGSNLDGIGGPLGDECLLVNNENALPSTPTTPYSPFGEPRVLKSGYLVERRFGPVKKRSFKNFIHPKRRLVILTESMLNWQKINSKESTASSMANALNMAAAEHQHFSFMSSFGEPQQQQKSQIPLSEVTSVSAIMDAKNSFRVATVNTEVHFQAGSEADMNEWIILILKQQRRHLMHLNRPSSDYSSQMFTVQQAAAEIDIERELHTMYNQLAEHFDTLCKHGWCCRYMCAQCGIHHQHHEQQEHQDGEVQEEEEEDMINAPFFVTNADRHHHRRE